MSVAIDTGLAAEHPVKAKPKRRWFQCGRWTLLMLFCWILCGWLAYTVKQSRDQRAAAKAIEELGGLVEYEPASGDGTLPAMAWLGQLFGEDWSANAAAVSLADSAITDAGLEHLRGLTKLRHLDLRRTRITDAGLVHLKGLTRLEQLDLRRTQVTDAGLVHLKGLPQIRMLDVWGTQVTDEGVTELQEALPWLGIIY
jgi:hypothetical protein